ncbi:NUDIX hydrolase [Nocardioides caldifontis]|uniref:NUDIX hydrolase n=1 Tax=Nocardioides caldifontis TaxID=2588938 RepID=UPI0011DF037E|nr:NUDIX hydrolase [Nocardioides caldifontis]
MPQPAVVPAAGAVVLRRATKGKQRSEVLLVHRPRYDDWSFPKGKLDPGETAHVAAVREVEEETGVAVRLGPPLPPQLYLVRAGDEVKAVKQVHYWVGRALDDGHDVAAYEPNDEVDAVRWLPADRAATELTYEHDRATLRDALLFEQPTTPLVVLRHALALDKASWSKADEKRPLSEDGEQQARDLVPLLRAYGAARLVSSSSRRCWTTLSPYADHAGLELECTDDLAKGAEPDTVALVTRRLLRGTTPTVLCTHREVLPAVLDALHLAPLPIDKGAAVVVHHHEGRIAAVEPVSA